MSRRHSALTAVLLSLAVGRAEEIVELGVDNFDQALLGHEDVLVHFYAPWSVRCKEFSPILEQLSNSGEYGGKLHHARSDISGEGGYTSYLDAFGILKLPTLVLFRNGHPTVYDIEGPIDSYEAITAWLDTTMAMEKRPRNPGTEIYDAIGGPTAQYAQLEDHHKKLRAKQLAQEASNKAAQNKANTMPSSGKVPTPRDEVPASLGDAPADAARRALAEDPVGGGAAAEAAEAAEASDAAGPAKVDQAADADGGGAAAAGERCAPLEKDALGVTDSDFEKVVMDKSVDVFVLFYRPSPGFCAGNGTGYAGLARYAASMADITVAHMDTSVHKSPFVFETDELPVVMLFPAADKRPLEYDQEMTTAQLAAFAHEHCPSLKGTEYVPGREDEPPKAEL